MDAPQDDEAPPRLPAPPDEPAVWIDRPGPLARLCAQLGTSAEIAIDTESNSMHAYRERTCIVQVTADGTNAILDALALGDLAPLGRALDRPDVEVVFHGGDYDVACLTRDHGFRFHRVFDTMIAATLLGEARVGLAHLVETHFGYTLRKKYQRADWARRPLTPDQLDYLRRDTLYLPALRAHLMARLEADDLVEEARIEFDRLAAREGTPAEQPDPEGWRRIKGAGRLDDLGRAVLAALHAWREAEAERRDVPPFKVMAPARMRQLAADPPRRAHHPRALPFLTHGERARYGRQVVTALQTGIADHAAGRVPPARRGRPPSPEEALRHETTKQREDALRAWRRGEIEARGVPGVVVLPNPAIAWLAAEMPSTVDALAACPDIGPKRAARDGEAILAVLRRSAKGGGGRRRRGGQSSQSSSRSSSS